MGDFPQLKWIGGIGLEIGIIVIISSVIDTEFILFNIFTIIIIIIIIIITIFLIIA